MSAHSALPTAVGPTAACAVLPCGRGAEPGGRRAGQSGRAEGPPALHAACQPVPLLPGEGQGGWRGRRRAQLGGEELVRRGALTGPLQGNGGTEGQRRRGWACGGLPQSWRVATSPLHSPDRPAGNSCGPAITASPVGQLLSSDSGVGNSPSSRAFSARQPAPLRSGRWGLGCASEITGGVGSRQGFQAPGF